MNSRSLDWAFNTLQNLGYSLQDEAPTLILQTVWSCVYRFNTNKGYCYLKQVPQGLSAEPQVINFLREKCGASVPLLIANNTQTHCFLMQDAGIPLRKYFKQGFNAELLITAIHDYIAVQCKSIPYLDHLLNLDASDWRLEKIPECYASLIQQKNLLMADGLTEIELEQLSKLTPKVALLCEQLFEHKLSNTFSHNDFHDNNLLIDPETQKVTLVDLGEVAVTHPFFSLLNILHHVKENCALEEDAYQYLQEQALQPWLDYASQDQLLVAMSLMQEFWPIHRALTEYRLITSIESQSAQQLLRRGRFFKNLKVWLAAL